jgi:serine/threonine protein kinase
MNEEDTLNKIVEAATQLPDHEINNFLHQQTQNNPELLKKAQDLIDQIKIEESISESSASIDLTVGDTIGPYHLLEVLGQGGMGIVFLVEQKHPVQRRLALKIIKLGMDSKNVLARFEMERRALALMSHPNVSAVIDAGITEQGRPYFVMEYVPGIPITEYADKHYLTIKQRVELIIQACKGVLHAHQKGILHRDIKPGNVLVTDKDREPLVKIIDFGVAKSTQQKLVNETVYTRLGVFIGTPNYTSPEQAGSTPLDVDTRTDVYSLGMILYELLVGKLPYSSDTFQNKSLVEVQKIIQEHHAPTPLNRLKTIRFAQKKIATQRKSSFSELRKILKGDLNVIVMHAIEKDRIERYESVSAFSADLKRFLKGLPVEAQPQTSLYKLKKFIARNKFLVASLLSILIALATGLGVALTALKQAEKEKLQSSAVLSLINDVLMNASPWNKSNRNEITLNDVVNELEIKLDNKELLNNPQFDQAKKLGLEALLVRTLREQVGNIQYSVGDFKAAESNLRKAIIGYENKALKTDLKQVELQIKLSNVLAELGQFEQAESLFKTAFAEINPPSSIDEAKAYLLFNNLYKLKSEHDLDIEFRLKQLKVADEYFTKNSTEYAQQLLNVSNSYYYAYELGEALKYAKLALLSSQELNPSNQDLEAESRNKIVSLLTSMGDSDQSIYQGEKFVEWSEHMFGSSHIRTIDAKLTLVYVYIWLGDSKKVLDLVSSIEPVLSSIVSQDHYLMQKLYNYQGTGLYLADRFLEAVQIDEKALSLAKSKNIKADISHFSGKIASNYYYLGDLDKAQNYIEQAIDYHETKQGWNISAYYFDLAQIHLANNRYKEAENAALKSKQLDSTNPIGDIILGMSAYYQNNMELAIKHLSTAKDGYKNLFGSEDENYLLILADLILVLSEAGLHQEALKLIPSQSINDSGSVGIAVVNLSFLATQSVNKIKVDKNNAKNLFQRVKEHWSDKTIQYHSAARSAEIIGITL